MCSPNTNRPRWKQGITKIINNKKWNPAHPPYPHCLLPQQKVRTNVVNYFQHARKRGNNVLCCEQLACTVDERCVKTHPPKKELANAYCAGVYKSRLINSKFHLHKFGNIPPLHHPPALEKFPKPTFQIQTATINSPPLYGCGTQTLF